ncbi:hypothetical protein ACHAXR_002698, partial [Thalassiosira sp. AJA248-18]
TRVNKPRKDPQTEEWSYPTLEVVLEEVGLQPIRHYIEVRRCSCCVPNDFISKNIETRGLWGAQAASELVYTGAGFDHTLSVQHSPYTCATPTKCVCV